jgi:hypothetical protein
MKKSKKATRVIGRIGRNPVIAVRVPPPLHHRITESAKASGRSMSEEMAALLTRGFEWQDAFGDRVEMLSKAQDEINQMVRGNLEAEMRRKGWKPVHGSPYWIDPEAAPKSGWVDPEAPLPSGWTDLGDIGGADLDQIVEKLAEVIKAKVRTPGVSQQPLKKKES